MFRKKITLEKDHYIKLRRKASLSVVRLNLKSSSEKCFDEIMNHFGACKAYDLGTLFKRDENGSFTRRGKRYRNTGAVVFDLVNAAGQTITQGTFLQLLNRMYETRNG